MVSVKSYIRFVQVSEITTVQLVPNSTTRTLLPTCWEHHQWTRCQQFYNMLATISPLMDKILPHPNILTSQDVGLSQQCCTTASNRNEGFEHVIGEYIQLQASTLITLCTHDLGPPEFFGLRRNTWLQFGEQFFKYWQLHAKVVS